MNTSPSALDISLETSVGTLVRAQPLLARVFEELGIDYCCGGKMPLARAFAEAGFDPRTALRLLNSSLSQLRSEPALDVNALSLTALANHIEETHHR